MGTVWISSIKNNIFYSLCHKINKKNSAHKQHDKCKKDPTENKIAPGIRTVYKKR